MLYFGVTGRGEGRAVKSKTMGAETQLKDIKPNRVNPRTIEEKRARALAADLEKFGDLSGIVNNVNPEWTVLVSGHQRMEVFRRGNGSLVITERYDEPEKDGTVARGFIYMDEQRYTYREVIWDKAKSDEATIKANGEYGQWDNAVLTNEWQFTVEQFQDFGIPALVFETNALNSEKQEAQEDNYTPPEVIETDIVTGDLFEIGPHRLLCGDSTNADDVAKVMGGEKVDFVFTDPPYGIDWNTDYTRFRGGLIPSENIYQKIENDEKEFDPNYWLATFDNCLFFGANCFSNKLPKGNWIVWDKRFQNGEAFLADAEVAWYNGGGAVYILQETHQGFVSSDKKRFHPTQKPVKLFEKIFEKIKVPEKLLDPFLGSGTTMVAAHQLNRRCYGIEIDPKYCQVIIDRMRKLDPDIEIKRNGQPY